MGQEPLAPPSVKGWDGGPAWINTNTLLARFNFVNALLATGRPAAVRKREWPQPTRRRSVVAATRSCARRRIEPGRIVATIVTDAVQNDITSDVRATLLAFLNSSGDVPTAGSQVNAVPFGPRITPRRSAAHWRLTLNLPVNQLN